MTATKQQQHHDEETSNGTNENGKHIEAIKYKTKMCRNWVTKGSCPYNEKCMFAHGDSELRSVSLNTNQGLETEDDIRRFRRSGHGVGDHAQHQPPAPQRTRNESGRPYPAQRGPQQHYHSPQPHSYHHNPYQPQYDYYGVPQDGPCQCPDCMGPRGYDYRGYYAPPPPPQPMPCPCEECAQAAGYSYAPEPEYPVYTEDAVHTPTAECVAP